MNPDNQMAGNPARRKSLKKVRRRFVNTRPTGDEKSEIDPSPRYLAYKNVHLIRSFLCIVEHERKIFAGTQYLEPYFHITLPPKEEVSSSSSNTVTLRFYVNQNNSMSPWQYIVKRLESYGDADSLGWAQYITKYYTTYPEMMADYFKLIKSEDPKTCIALTKARAQSVLAIREIESKCSYRKLLAFASKDSTDLISYSYSEGFLKILGHTMEEFPLWVNNNGLPVIFQKDNGIQLDIARKFFEFTRIENGIIQEEHDYSAQFYDKEGNLFSKVVQMIKVIEPAENGFFISAYFIVKDKEGGIIIRKENGNERIIIEDDAKIENAPMNEEEILEEEDESPGLEGIEDDEIIGK